MFALQDWGGRGRTLSPRGGEQPGVRDRREKIEIFVAGGGDLPYAQYEKTPGGEKAQARRAVPLDNL